MNGIYHRQVALVTGANRGIGREIARQLANLGLQVILSARNQDDAEGAAREMRGENNKILARQLDVADENSIMNLKRGVERDFGRLDVLVNNAGILPDRHGRFSNISLELVKQVFETNLYGAWRLSQVFMPLMNKNGYGRIVNISSGAGQFDEIQGGGGGWPAYSLSKTALNALTVGLASEMRGTNILVNAVCPGWVRTDMGGPGASRTVEKGAETPVWLATLPANGPSGGFFRDKKLLSW